MEVSAGWKLKLALTDGGVTVVSGEAEGDGEVDVEVDAGEGA